MNPVPFLDLHRQYEEIRDEIDEAIRSVLADADFVDGKRVAAFEADFASYLDAPHCVSVANGTDAIEIALETMGLPPGSEVIVQANSFIASSEAISRVGLVPVFADVDEATWAIDPEDVERRISDRTSAIFAVHLYGHPAPMGPLMDLASKVGATVVEDAAQAHGAEYRGRRVGLFGAVGTFSFYPGKNLGAYGDGGAIVTGDEKLAKRMRMLANHGRTRKYEHEFEGRNSRLDALQAAVLSVKLRRLDEWNSRRRRLAFLYAEGLTGVGDLRLQVEAPDCKSVYHLLVGRTSVRDDLAVALTEAGIGHGVHYPVALPRLEAYANHPQHREPFRAVQLSEEIISLPMGDSISEDQVDRVIEVVRGFFGA